MYTVKSEIKIHTQYITHVLCMISKTNGQVYSPTHMQNYGVIPPLLSIRNGATFNAEFSPQKF